MGCTESLEETIPEDVKDYILTRIPRCFRDEAQPCLDQWYDSFKARFRRQIPKKYVMKLYNRFFPDRNNEEVYENLLARYCGDSNNRIDFKAFAVASYKSYSILNSTCQQSLTFPMFDIHSSGRLCVADIQYILEGHIQILGCRLRVAARNYANEIVDVLHCRDRNNIAPFEYHYTLNHTAPNDHMRHRWVNIIHFLEGYDIALLAIANNVHNSLGYSRSDTFMSITQSTDGQRSGEGNDRGCADNAGACGYDNPESIPGTSRLGKSASRMSSSDSNLSRIHLSPADASGASYLLLCPDSGLHTLAADDSICAVEQGKDGADDNTTRATDLEEPTHEQCRESETNEYSHSP